MGCSKEVAEEPPGAEEGDVGENDGARLAEPPQAGKAATGVEPRGDDEGGGIGDGEKHKGVVGNGVGKTEVKEGVDGALGAAGGAVESGEGVEGAAGQPCGLLRVGREEDDAGGRHKDEGYQFVSQTARFLFVSFSLQK